MRQTIKEKTGIISKPWQVSVMLDIVYTNKNVVMSAGTGSGKSLPYQLIFLINIDAIVLVILPKIALMSNQVCSTIYPTIMLEIYILISSQYNSIRRLGISAVALTAKTTRDDPSV